MKINKTKDILKTAKLYLVDKLNWARYSSDKSLGFKSTEGAEYSIRSERATFLSLVVEIYTRKKEKVWHKRGKFGYWSRPH